MSPSPMPIEKYARLRAEMEAGHLRDSVLAGAGLGVDEWTRTQSEWLERMGADLERGRFELSNRYTEAFVERQRELTAAAPKPARGAVEEPDGSERTSELPGAPPPAFSPPAPGFAPAAPGFGPPGAAFSGGAAFAPSQHGAGFTPRVAAPPPLAATPPALARSAASGQGGSLGQTAMGDFPLLDGAALPFAHQAPAATRPPVPETGAGVLPFKKQAAGGVSAVQPAPAAAAAKPAPDPSTGAGAAAPPAKAKPRFGATLAMEALSFEDITKAALPFAKATPGKPSEHQPSGTAGPGETLDEQPHVRDGALPFQRQAAMAAKAGAGVPQALPFTRPSAGGAGTPPPATPAGRTSSSAPPARAAAPSVPPPDARTPSAPPPAAARTSSAPPPGGAPARTSSVPPAGVAASPPRAPAPSFAVEGLTLEQHASLCAEIAFRPDKEGEALARYRVDRASKAAVDQTWKARFAADPALEAQWQRAYSYYFAFLGRKK